MGRLRATFSNISKISPCTPKKEVRKTKKKEERPKGKKNTHPHQLLTIPLLVMHIQHSSHPKPQTLLQTRRVAPVSMYMRINQARDQHVTFWRLVDRDIGGKEGGGRGTGADEGDDAVGYEDVGGREEGGAGEDGEGVEEESRIGGSRVCHGEDCVGSVVLTGAFAVCWW